ARALRQRGFAQGAADCSEIIAYEQWLAGTRKIMQPVRFIPLTGCRAFETRDECRTVGGEIFVVTHMFPPGGHSLFAGHSGAAARRAEYDEMREREIYEKARRNSANLRRHLGDEIGQGEDGRGIGDKSDNARSDEARVRFEPQLAP